MDTKTFNQVRLVSLEELTPYARNSRLHPEDHITQIARSIEAFGFTNPILTDGDNGIIAGHGRFAAAKKLGLKSVPVISLEGLSEEDKRALVIADNKLTDNSAFDIDVLRAEMAELRDIDYDLSLTGFSEDELDDLFGDDDDDEGEGVGSVALADKFLIPPFSVLNAREGWWQDRKRKWISLGIRSEEGRSNSNEGGGSTFAKGRESGEKMDDTSKKIIDAGNTTSIFDPVLCELVYRWFSPEGGLILDPFAGGSVRGIVAAKLGREYYGSELRPEQVEANREQWNGLADKTVSGFDATAPIWHCGDSRQIDEAKVEADMIFSCPPYANLEVYSDDPKDLSTLPYDKFKLAYAEIIKKACSRLRMDSFACFVVGEVRDKKGFYYNFVSDTIQAFQDAGLRYYNEAILVTAVASLSLRAGKQFSASRKLGKTHQNVLVFVKGDPKLAAKRCGDPMIPAAAFPEEVEEGVVICPNCGHNWDRKFDVN